jgi:hypothetical protein
MPDGGKRYNSPTRGSVHSLTGSDGVLSRRAFEKRCGKAAARGTWSDVRLVCDRPTGRQEDAGNRGGWNNLTQTTPLRQCGLGGGAPVSARLLRGLALTA